MDVLRDIGLFQVNKQDWVPPKTAIVLNYDLVRGGGIDYTDYASDPYLRFDYKQTIDGELHSTKGMSHGKESLMVASATFNLTTDQIYDPTVYWTPFGEFAGLDLLTVRYNFDFT